jgi:Domain of unknown function (DUF4352)
MRVRLPPVTAIRLKPLVLALLLVLTGCSLRVPGTPVTETKTVTIASPAQPTSAPEESLAPTAPVQKGQPGEDGNILFTVTDDTVMNTIPDGREVVFVTLKNIGTIAATYEAAFQAMIDSEGRQFSFDTKWIAENTSPLAVISADLNPGIALEVVMAFKISRGTEPVAVVLHGSASSPGVTMALA